ncbi:uncharacterized protein LOC112567325 [Pomacea canaliculata]|uniref:uncharacterized protein LOC112567325 n=1 Tax=Pomacea canaliculata TaxID=400727 RepID=UPI000D73FA21|nr:uncharacterized protein LOC112567325 [Pomacea canaliculata]XP_025099878.1 uncharacterized protein LOC112567325 [Pomacea canaliculata]XP_025099929.1 uncharacterized protein LOC112567325 [Pomacea canaliculata]
MKNSDDAVVLGLLSSKTEEVYVKKRMGKISGAILLLMDTYAKHKEQFALPTMKKIEVWKRIASEMAASGCHFAPAAIEKKWSNMKIRKHSLRDYQYPEMCHPSKGARTAKKVYGDSRKRKRPNNESSEQLQSCHVRNLAVQEEIMAEERQRIELDRQRTELDRQRLEFMRNTEIEQNL